MTLIRLTDYRTGRPVLVEPDSIAAVCPCEACVADYMPGTPPTEHPERTRIDLHNGRCVLVRELSDEIAAAIAAAKPPA